ncbi:hypothetical protein JXJ21_23805 [candidate division KSB1 bacterium]|nr:hypothetical protein [candidate division KSB1 bacterium]
MELKDEYMLAFEKGMKLIEQEQFAEAKQEFLFSLEGNRRRDDRQAIAVNLYFLAQLYAREGDKATARDHIEELKSIYRHRDDPAMLDKVGELEREILAYEPEPLPSEKPVDGIELFNEGKIVEAKDVFKRDIILFGHAGQEKFMAISLFYLAQCELLLSHLKEAEVHLANALKISKKIGYTVLARQIEEVIAEFQKRIGDVAPEPDIEHLISLLPVDAEDLAKELVRILKSCERAIAAGDVENAENLLDQARKSMPASPSNHLLILLFFIESKFLKARGSLKNAKIIAERALNLAQQVGDDAVVTHLKNYMVLIPAPDAISAGKTP